MMKTRKKNPLNWEVRHQLREEYLKLEAQRNEKSMKKNQSDELLLDKLSDYQKDLLKIGFISLLFYFNVQDGVFWIGCSPTGFLWLIAAVGTIYL